MNSDLVTDHFDDTKEGLDEDIKNKVKERSISELIKLHTKDEAGMLLKRNKKRRFKPKRKSVTGPRENPSKTTRLANKRRMKPKVEKKTTAIPIRKKKTTTIAPNKHVKYEDVTSDMGKINDVEISDKNETFVFEISEEILEEVYGKLDSL